MVGRGTSRGIDLRTTEVRGCRSRSSDPFSGLLGDPSSGPVHSPVSREWEMLRYRATAHWKGLESNFPTNYGAITWHLPFSRYLTLKGVKAVSREWYEIRGRTRGPFFFLVGSRPRIPTCVFHLGCNNTFSLLSAYQVTERSECVQCVCVSVLLCHFRKSF